MSVCDRNCFECPYPDCIMDELDAEDYKEARRIEREIINPRSSKQKKIAAYQKAYREANRERYNAYMREYRRKRRAASC